MPGFYIAIKMESIPNRLLLALEKDLENQRDVYQSLIGSANAMNSDLTALPRCGTLILMNWGAVRTTATDCSGVSTLNRSFGIMR